MSCIDLNLTLYISLYISTIINIACIFCFPSSDIFGMLLLLYILIVSFILIYNINDLENVSFNNILDIMFCQIFLLAFCLSIVVYLVVTYHQRYNSATIILMINNLILLVTSYCHLIHYYQYFIEKYNSRLIV